ncbi:MAG: hypothetical protein QXF76_00545 [Candidatus Anstonellales archaeon]
MDALKANREIRALANIEYEVLAKELDQIITTKWFTKFQVCDKFENLFRLKIQSHNLLIYLPKSMFLFNNQIQNEDLKNLLSFQTNKFTDEISKCLENKKVVSLRKIANDRIISVNFREYSLIFELFGKGNIILVSNNDNKIVSCLRNEVWKDRKIDVDEEYKMPISERLPENFSEFKKFIYQNEKDFIIVRLSRLPIGINYMKIILRFLNIAEKEKAISLSEEKLEKIWNSINELQRHIRFVIFSKELSNGNNFDEELDFSFFDITKYSLDNEYQIKAEYKNSSELLFNVYYAEILKLVSENKEDLSKNIEYQKNILIQKISMKEKEVELIKRYYFEIQELLNKVKNTKDSIGSFANLSYKVEYDDKGTRKLIISIKE